MEMTPEQLREVLKDMKMLFSRADVKKAFPFKEEEYRLDNQEWDTFKRILNGDGRNLFYEFLTTDYVDALADYIRTLPDEHQIAGRQFSILEVGAGSGRLAHFLRDRLGKGFKYEATDSGKFGISPLFLGEPIENADDETVFETKSPDLVIASWMTNMSDWTTNFRKCPTVKEYILIGDRSVCGNPFTYGKVVGTSRNRTFDQEGFSINELTDLSRLQICVTDPGVHGQSRSTTLSFKRNS